MKLNPPQNALTCAIHAARAAGKIMRDNLRAEKKINETTQHDLKIELDVRCQKRIERVLKASVPDAAILGEEGVASSTRAEFRWVIDPIDGTVNFAYGIPHACVSIALQTRVELKTAPANGDANYQTVLGVIYNPFCEELWTATCNGPARLNGRIIRVSTRTRLAESIITLGFSKNNATLDKMLRGFNRLIHRVRKLRIMGSAALDLAYVACGRFDAYIEPSVRLWDIAAGGLILERAGGEFWHKPVEGEHAYRVIASNGRLRRQLQKLV